MNYINGEDRILYIKYNGVYMPIGCLTGNTFDETAEMLDTTTRDNKGWATSKPVMQSYSIGFSGIQVNSTVVGGDFSIASYDKLCSIKRAKILLDWKIQGKNFPIVDYGQGYFTDLGEANNVDELMSFTGSITGFGEPKKTALGTVLLNNGNPTVIIATDNTETELLRVSKF